MSCFRNDTTKTAAFLCALVKAMDNRGMLAVALGDVDWTEAGVTRAEFDAWHAEHVEADALA